MRVRCPTPAPIRISLRRPFSWHSSPALFFASELAHSHLQRWIGAERAFRDDTLRYRLCGFNLDPLEAMWVDINCRLKRGKAFDEGRVQGRLVAALDGIEVVSSFSRRRDHLTTIAVAAQLRGWASKAPPPDSSTGLSGVAPSIPLE